MLPFCGPATFLHVPHEVEVTLRLTVCLGIEHPCGTRDQILFPVGMLLSEIYGAPSLMRGRVCNLWCNHSMVPVAQNPKPYFTLFWDSLNLEGQVPVFISPRNRVECNRIIYTVMARQMKEVKWDSDNYFSIKDWNNNSCKMKYVNFNKGLV
jgi:hypothetical protein